MERPGCWDCAGDRFLCMCIQASHSRVSPFLHTRAPQVDAVLDALDIAGGSPLAVISQDAVRAFFSPAGACVGGGGGVGGGAGGAGGAIGG